MIIKDSDEYMYIMSCVAQGFELQTSRCPVLRFTLLRQEGPSLSQRAALVAKKVFEGQNN